jgi:hypothetical protein
MPDNYFDSALALFHEDDKGTFMSGSLMNLLSDIHMAVVRGQTIPPVINQLV